MSAGSGRHTAAGFPYRHRIPDLVKHRNVGQLPVPDG